MGEYDDHGNFGGADAADYCGLSVGDTIQFYEDCACLFSKRNTDITSNIAKYSIEFHFLQGRKGQQSIAVKSFYDNYCSYCTMQN